MSRLLVGMILALALVVAGCGGDDDKDTGGGGGDATPTAAASVTAGPKEDWQDDVNAVCTKNQAEIQKIAQDVAGDGTSDPAKAAADLLDKTVGVEENLLDELGDVDVPDDVQEDYDAFLDRIGDTLPLFGDLAKVLRDGKEDPDLTKKLQDIANDTRPFATENNLTACLSDAGPAAPGS